MGFRLPFFPMYAAETLADGRFQGWNLEERGAWITLLCANWNDGDIPESVTELGRMLRVTTGDMTRIWSAIGDRFCHAPGATGRLVCPRLEEERDKANSLSSKRAESGLKGASARWNKGKPLNGKRIALPSQPHGNPNANAMRPQCPQPSPSPSPPSTEEKRQRPLDVLGEEWRKEYPASTALLAALDASGLVLERPRKANVSQSIERDAAVLGAPAAALIVAEAHRSDPNPYLGWYAAALHKATNPPRPVTRAPAPVSTDFSRGF